MELAPEFGAVNRSHRVVLRAVLTEASRRLADEDAIGFSAKATPHPMFTIQKESALAHRLLDGLSGIEIGGSAYNPFNIPECLNVDYTADVDTVFKLEERKLAGSSLPVDIVAPGDRLPFPDDSLDYVLHSHVLEHFFDPIAAVKEWLRVLKPAGVLFMIIPHASRNSEQNQPRTTLLELIDRHEGRIKKPEPFDESAHHSVWATEDVLELVQYLGLPLLAVQDVDDKVGNGFTIACAKPHPPSVSLEPCEPNILDGVPVLFSVDKLWIDTNAIVVPNDQRRIALDAHLSSSIRIRGWAAGPVSGGLASAVSLYLDKRRICDAYYGLERPDVAAFMNRPDLHSSGFGFAFHGSTLGPGKHDLSVTIKDAAADFCYRTGTIISILVRSGP